LSEVLPKLKRQQARDRCRLWKLKEKEVCETFREEVHSESISRSKGNVNQMWKELAECLNTAANKACGRASGKQRKNETGWWNGEVAEAIKKKRELYRIAHQTKKEEDKAAYKLAKKDAKKAVARAKEAEGKRLGDILDKENGRQNVFRIVKQMTKQNREVTESSCIKNKDEKIVTDECSVRKIWKEHFDKLLNEEFEWDRNGLPSTDMVCGPCEIITPEEVKVAIGETKVGKAAGPSGVASEMLKAAGEDGIM